VFDAGVEYLTKKSQAKDKKGNMSFGSGKVENKKAIQWIFDSMDLGAGSIDNTMATINLDND
jgi:hypothetical protein